MYLHIHVHVHVYLFTLFLSQMEIFDAYIEEIAKQEKAKEKKSSKPGGEKGKDETKKSSGIEMQVTLINMYMYMYMYICTIYTISTSK